MSDIPVCPNRGCCLRGYKGATTVATLVLALLLGFTARAYADDVAKARDHYKRGSTLYYLQRYLEAAAEYERAFELRDDPSLLFNIGQAYRLGGDGQKAIGAYRSYLAREPGAPNRAEVLALIEDTKKTIEAQKRTREKPPTNTLPAEKMEQKQATPPPPAVVAPVKPTPPPPPPPEGPPPRALRLAGFGAGAAGIAALALGAVFTGLYVTSYAELNTPRDMPFDHELKQRADAFGIAGPTLLALGGAALVAGGALYAIGKKRGQEPRLHAWAGPNGAGATLRLDF